MAFVSCSSCQRFVAPSDSACPFCGTTVVHVAKPSKRLRVARSAMLAAAIAAGPACSTSTTPEDAGPGTDVPMADAGPGTDAGPTQDTGSTMDAGPDAFDAGTPLPPYGIPPMDVGVPDAGPDSPPAPLYGAPPPDAG